MHGLDRTLHLDEGGRVDDRAETHLVGPAHEPAVHQLPFVVGRGIAECGPQHEPIELCLG